MRVVLDTNVWISALVFPGGVCDQLVRKLRESPSVVLLTSPFILQEFERVLVEKFGYAQHDAEPLRRAVEQFSTVVEPQGQVTVIHHPDADNRILECAVDGQADLLVTGDAKHLLPLQTFRGIRICSPREILDLLG